MKKLSNLNTTKVYTTVAKDIKTNAVAIPSLFLESAVLIEVVGAVNSNVLLLLANAGYPSSTGGHMDGYLIFSGDGSLHHFKITGVLFRIGTILIEMNIIGARIQERKIQF